MDHDWVDAEGFQTWMNYKLSDQSACPRCGHLDLFTDPRCTCTDPDCACVAARK